MYAQASSLTTSLSSEPHSLTLTWVPQAPQTFLSILDSQWFSAGILIGSIFCSSLFYGDTSSI